MNQIHIQPNGGQQTVDERSRSMHSPVPITGGADPMTLRRGLLVAGTVIFTLGVVGAIALLSIDAYRANTAGDTLYVHGIILGAVSTFVLAGTILLGGVGATAIIRRDFQSRDRRFDNLDQQCAQQAEAIAALSAQVDKRFASLSNQHAEQNVRADEATAEIHYLAAPATVRAVVGRATVYG